MWKPLPDHKVLAFSEINIPYLKALVSRLRTHDDITWPEYEALMTVLEANDASR